MLAIGRKNEPSHAVPLMSADSVPYVWDRAARGVRVRGQPQPGVAGQRRRFVHPVQPVGRNQSIRAELDFQVDAFGDPLDPPIVLGLFSSGQPIESVSLSLQIAGPGQVRVVLAEHGEPKIVPLSIPGGMKTGRTYRLAFDIDGATGRVQTTLSDPASGTSQAAPIQSSVLPASERFAWDELGIALWEATSVPIASQNSYRYLLVKAACRR
jgi:hypothetical protein